MANAKIKFAALAGVVVALAGCTDDDHAVMACRTALNKLEDAVPVKSQRGYVIHDMVTSGGKVTAQMTLTIAKNTKKTHQVVCDFAPSEDGTRTATLVRVTNSRETISIADADNRLKGLELAPITAVLAEKNLLQIPQGETKLTLAE